MSTQARGLQNFISDLRNAKGKVRNNLRSRKIQRRHCRGRPSVTAAKRLDTGGASDIPVYRNSGSMDHVVRSLGNPINRKSQWSFLCF